MTRHAGVAAIAIAAAALMASACAATEGPDVTSTDAIGAVPDGARCGDPATPRLQSGNHLIGDAEPPVPYSSNPPTSGWHASGALQLGVVEEPLSGPRLVSALEAGHVVVAYDPDAVEESTRDRLRELATTTFTDRLTVTEWAPMASPLALLGWGVLQRCTELDEDALAEFVLNHFGAAQVHG